MLKLMYDYGIGRTPLLELPELYGNRVFLKLESKNYLGSIKARTAYGMVRNLNVGKEYTIVESTSGNLGAALGFFCREEGRRFLCLLDETVIDSKRKHLEDSGIEYEIVPTISGLDGRTSRIKHAQELMKKGGFHWINQYDNEDGVNIHKQTTGAEIFEQTNGEVTCIISPIGSGGTICGIGEYFKMKAPDVKIIGVEPYGSTIFHSCDAPYITVGAGLRGKPGNIKRHIEVITTAICISDEMSINKFRELNKRYHADVGITTGMTYVAAEQYCKMTRNEVVVIIAADGVNMYNEYL